MSRLRAIHWLSSAAGAVLLVAVVFAADLSAQDDGMNLLPPIPDAPEEQFAESSDLVPVPPSAVPLLNRSLRIAASDDWSSHDGASGGLPSRPLVMPPKDVAKALRERQQERESRYRKLTEQLRRIIDLQQEQRLREDRRRYEAEAAALKALADAQAAAAARPQEPQPLELPIPPESEFTELPDTPPPATVVQLPESPPTEDNTSPGESAPEVASNQPETATNDTAADGTDEPSMEKSDHHPDTMDAIFTTNATSVVEGPVDRIGLADNLYALGETRVALEMYQQVDLRHVTVAEAHWVSFQQASCFRKLGKPDEARETYRRLAGKESAGWLSKMARWWLDQMDERDAIEQHIAAQAAQLEKTKSAVGNASTELPGQ